MNTFIVTAVEKKTSSKANEQEKVAISVLKFSEIEKPHEYISQKSKRQRNSLLDKLNKTMNSSRFLSNLGNSVKSLKGLKSSRKTNSRTNVQPTEEEIRAMEAGNEWEKASTERVQSNRLSAIQRTEADNEVVRNRKLDNAAGVGELLKGDYFLQAGNRIQLSFHGSRKSVGVRLDATSRGSPLYRSGSTGESRGTLLNAFKEEVAGMKIAPLPTTLPAFKEEVSDRVTSMRSLQGDDASRPASFLCVRAVFNILVEIIFRGAKRVDFTDKNMEREFLHFRKEGQQKGLQSNIGLWVCLYPLTLL